MKVSQGSSSNSAGKIIKKKEKRNQQKQIQINKEKEIKLNQKLFSGSGKLKVPKNCVLVPLCNDLDLDSIVKSFVGDYSAKFHLDNVHDSQDISMDPVVDANNHNVESKNGMTILDAEKFRQKIAFIPTKRDLLSVLDATRVAGMLI